MGKTPLLADGGPLAGPFPLGRWAGLELNPRLEPLILPVELRWWVIIRLQADDDPKKSRYQWAIWLEI